MFNFFIKVKIMVNVSKLETKEYSNYKTLCLVLGEDVLEGNSKKKQMVDWLRYFDWEKVPSSNKILVKEIYKFPKVKKKKKRNVSLSEFNKKLETLIAIYLYENGTPIEQDGKEYLLVKMYKYQLYMICGFGGVMLKHLMDEVSEEKEKAGRSKKVYAPAGSVKELFLKIFFESAGSKLKNSLVQIAKQGQIEVVKDFECYDEDWHKIEVSPYRVGAFEQKRRTVVDILNLTEIEVFGEKAKSETYTKIMRLILKHFVKAATNIIETTTLKADKGKIVNAIKELNVQGSFDSVKEQIRVEINEIITAQILEKIFKIDTKFNKKELFEQDKMEDIMDDEIDLLWVALSKYVKEYICLDKNKFKEILYRVKEEYLLKEKAKEEKEKKRKAESKIIADNIAKGLIKDLEALDKNIKT